MKEKGGYRADIDGLRAIAVLSVLFYHAGIKQFSGGFIGVDVFFVISGFLITGLITKEILANNFSILVFYERRIRRIFPAFFTVILAVAIIGGLIYSDTAYRDLGKSIVASATSTANLFFLSQAGYFDGPSLLKPLLHTWSLSVEEQFYFFLPLVLILVFRYFPKRSVFILGILVIASFALNVSTLQTNPEAAFYLAHLRAWELLIGGLIALKPIKIKPWIQDSLSIGGLIAILVSIFIYSENTQFPGVAAALPVLGTAFIINGGQDGNSIVGKILSFSPLVFIGKISYSLYLWHWPVLVFGKYYLIKQPSLLELAGLLALSLVLAILSWRFIETPFRSRDFLPGLQIFGFSANVLAFILLIGVLIDFSGGFPLRFDAFTNLVKSNTIGDPAKWNKCINAKGQFKSDMTPNICKIGIESQPSSFILWGDSHAFAIAVGLNISANQAGRGGDYAVMTGCPPLLGLNFVNNTTCYEFNNKILSYIKANPNLKTIIIMSRWAFYAEGTEFKQEQDKRKLLIAMLEPEKGSDNASLFLTGLERTVNELTKLGRKVIIISPIPEIAYNPPSAFFIATITQRDVSSIISPTYNEFLDRNKLVFSGFHNVVNQYDNVNLIDITNILCNKKSCKVVKNDRLLYSDDNHLSSYGSSLLADKFNEIFSK